MDHVTFSDIAERHGNGAAMNLLRTIERLAQIKSEILSMDCDARFEKAFRAMCETQQAAESVNFIPLDEPVRENNADQQQKDDQQGA